MVKKTTTLSLLFVLVVMAITLTAGAQTTTGNKANLAKAKIDFVCMQNAVDKRDTAVISVLDNYHTAVKQALETRKTALKAGWGMADRTARRNALKAGWQAFRDSHKTARDAFRKARKEAWKTFNTDRKACGVNGVSDEPGSEAMDVSL